MVSLRKQSYPFVRQRDSAVVVEDCASACSWYIHGVGVALLGTNLLTEHVDILKQYERVFVALDKDATDKAITMVRTSTHARADKAHGS